MSLVRVRRHQLFRALAGGGKTLVALEAAFVATPRVLALQTANVTAADGDCIPVDATAANRTVTLPAPAPGARVTVKLHATASAHTLTVARSGSGVKIDNATSDLSTSTAGTVYRLSSNGTDWFSF